MIVNTSNVNYTTGGGFDLPEGVNRYVLFMIAGLGDQYSNFPESVSVANQPASMLAQLPVTDETVQVWGASIPDSLAAGSYSSAIASTTFLRFFIAVFTGVSRDSVVDAKAHRNSSAASDGDSLEVATVGGGWVHDILWTNTTMTPGVGQSIIYNTAARAGISNKSGLQSGTATMSWSWSNARSAYAAISLRPARNTAGGVMIF